MAPSPRSPTLTFRSPRSSKSSSLRRPPLLSSSFRSHSTANAPASLRSYTFPVSVRSRNAARLDGTRLSSRMPSSRPAPADIAADVFDPLQIGNLPPMPYRDMPGPVLLGSMLGP